MCDIFVKRNITSQQLNFAKLTKSQILDTIPKDRVNKRNNELAKTHTEWRWRILKIKSSTFVEISYQKPNDDRLFITNKGEWTHEYDEKKFTQYVSDEYFVYSD